ncbi:glycosyltransferase [Acidimicrobiia bacterium]|nr:glycosyltransferase [Acidimicrobiia bacterium]
MKKIYINEAKESWIVDRFRSEFINNNPNICTENISEASLVWIIAPWTWKKIPKKYLQHKKVLCTIHHLEEKELKGKFLREFLKRDFYVDRYHLISKKTVSDIKSISNKEYTRLPFWVNPNNYFHIKDKNNLREKYQFSVDDFILGSFQRDSEGKNTNTPKLIKGPDRLIEIFEYYWKTQNKNNLKVLLSGYRRDYLINELEKRKIPYRYFERTDIKTLNELYNILDLYIVASRLEGGPQSIVEAAITKTPIISTDVGLSNEILSEEAIFNMGNYINAKPSVDHAYNNVQKLKIPDYFKEFKKIFEELLI